MSSIADPGELTQPSFEDFQRQTSLMTSCTLLWKELSDHFTSLEQDIIKKSEAIKDKIKTLDTETRESLQVLEKRELTIEDSVLLALKKVEECKEAALSSLGWKCKEDEGDGQVDDSEGLLLKLRSYCTKMNSKGFWAFVTSRKKELDTIRVQIPAALGLCVDPAKFVLEAMSEVFPVDKREVKSERVNDLGWACVVLLESLIPVVVDPILGSGRLLVTRKVKESAKEIAETWKASLDERGGIENVKTPDVHTFLQHLVTFGIVKKEDLGLYRKLVVSSAWRKQMPKLAVSLGLASQMPDMIEELISRGQQVDAVHFTYEVGLVDRYPPVPLLKAFLKDARKSALSISEDHSISGRAALAARKEQSALRAVIKCIEDYKLDTEFPPENLKKRLEQLEKVKPVRTEKKRPAVVPANKRTRASGGGPMPPAKAGRLTNAYVSSFPSPPAFNQSPSFPSPPIFNRSPSHTQYPTGVPQYQSPPPMYGNRSPPVTHYAYSPESSQPTHYAYSPEPAQQQTHYTYSPESAPPPTHYPYSPESAPPAIVGHYPGAPISYPAYGGYSNAMPSPYQQAYYR
jgi:hypothetical protein